MDASGLGSAANTMAAYDVAVSFDRSANTEALARPSGAHFAAERRLNAATAAGPPAGK